MKTLITISFAAIAALTVAGCNTFEGLGEDVSAGGKAISNTADKTSDAISGEEEAPAQ
jgi:predicted small secreted protein